MKSFFWILYGIIVGFLFELFAEAAFLSIRLFTYLFAVVRRKRPLGLDQVVQTKEGVNEKGPVVLIHGMNMDGVSLWPLRRKLRKAGWGPIFVFHMGPISWTIEENARLLKESLMQVHSHWGKSQVIAHSMGGIVCRLLIQEMGGEAWVQSLTTLASPHFGTPLARLSITVPGKQMVPKSRLLAQLNRQDRNRFDGVRWLFIWSNLDIIVPYPWGGPKVASSWSNVFQFEPFLGHMSILCSPKIFALIASNLECENHDGKGSRPPSPAGADPEDSLTPNSQMG